MSDRWGQFNEDSKIRERIAVLEAKLLGMEASIKRIEDSQTSNRAYSEKGFGEIKVELASMRTELGDLKAVIAAKPLVALDGNSYRMVLTVGIAFAVLIVVLLLLWVRLGAMGIHL